MPPPIFPERSPQPTSAFRDALKAIGVPICTGCGEMVLVDVQCDSPCGTRALWNCRVCSTSFVVPKVTKP